jgi:general L-amino acid transport system substrate-binding protein
VRERGQLNCGVNPGLTGFAAPNAEGVWEGFDVDLCRAISAAIFGTPDNVNYVPLSGETRFTALASGEVDLLARNSTWTFSRDTDLNLDFVAVNYYDGQGFLAPQGAGRDLGHRARRRHRLHPDRHHDRAQPRGLLPREQHHLRAGADRDDAEGRQQLLAGACDVYTTGCIGPRRVAVHLRERRMTT